MIKIIKQFFTASIKRQLTFGIVFVHALMMSIFVYDLVVDQKIFLNQQHAKKTKSLAKTLATNSSSWVLSNDFIGLEELVDSIKHYPSVLDIIVLNNSGQVLAHSNKEYIGKYISDEISERFLFNNKDKHTKIVFENSSKIDVVSPILRDTQHIGWARVVLSKKDITEGLKSVTIDGIIYTFIAIFIGIGFAIFMATGMTNGISKTIETIKKVKDGDSRARTNLDRVDEIGVLSHEFDRMLQKLSDQHVFLNIIIDSIPDLVFFKDYKNKGKYLGCNSAFSSFVGIKKEDIVGKTDYELFDEETAKFFIEKDKSVLEQNKMKQNEEWVTYPDGSKVLLDTLKTIFYDGSGQRIGIIGISRDITEKDQFQKELDSKNKVIFEQSKLASMGEMIGNIAHQWRQPLSVISTIASSYKLKKELNLLKQLDDTIVEDMEKIVENTQYLSRTIDDFRNFISGNSRKEKFDLKNDTTIFLQLVDSTIKNNEIEVILDLQEGINVKGYPNELIQCFINIFNNAKDALKEIDIEEKYIFISEYIENDKIVIKFKDNAGGIPEDIIGRVFEPYFTTKHKSQGTGIGLHMTYNLITQGMNGSLEVKNKEFIFNGKDYKGAEFILTIPLES